MDLPEKNIRDRLVEIETGLETQIADLIRLHERETGLTMNSMHMFSDKRLDIEYKSSNE